MKVLKLEEYRFLFKNETSFEEFVLKIRKALKDEDIQMIVTDDELLGIAINLKEVYQALAQGLSEKMTEWNLGGDASK